MYILYTIGVITVFYITILLGISAVRVISKGLYRRSLPKEKVRTGEKILAVLTNVKEDQNEKSKKFIR